MKITREPEDLRKAAFHGFLVLAALIEYRSTDRPFRKQLCGAWAGFHLVSVILDLTEE